MTETFDDGIEKAVRIYSRRLIGVAGFTWSDQDDICQEMRLELLRKLPQFDPRRAKRSTFVARVLESKVGELIRRRTAEKRDHRRQAYSLDAVVKDADGRAVSRAQLLSEADLTRRIRKRSRLPQYRQSLRENVTTALAALPEEHRALCQLIRRGGLTQLVGQGGTPPDVLALQIGQIRRHFMQAGVRSYVEE